MMITCRFRLWYRSLPGQGFAPAVAFGSVSGNGNRPAEGAGTGLGGGGSGSVSPEQERKGHGDGEEVRVVVVEALGSSSHRGRKGGLPRRLGRWRRGGQGLQGWELALLLMAPGRVRLGARVSLRGLDLRY